MPQWLTRWKTLEILAGDGRLQIGMAAGFKSERWPASNRNPGRLPVGIPGRLKSESATLFGCYFQPTGRRHRGSTAATHAGRNTLVANSHAQR